MLKKLKWYSLNLSKRDLKVNQKYNYVLKDSIILKMLNIWF